MIVELTEEDFRRLLTLVSVGERVSNDWMPEHQWSEEQQRNADLLGDLCTRAVATGAAELTSQERTTGDWMPSSVLDERTERMLRAYDEAVFWDQMIGRMAHKDLVAEYGDEALENLSPAHRQGAEDAIFSYYEREIDEHGLKRFTVSEKEHPPVRTSQRHNPASSSITKSPRDLE